MTPTSTCLTASAAAVLAALALTACTGAGPTGRTGADAAGERPGRAAREATTSASPAAPAEPTTPVSDPGPTGDAVFAVQKTVAELGVANAGLLDPAIDTGEEMLAPARLLLTPEALARYTATLPPEGQPGETSTDAGSAWQLIAHTACVEGEEFCPADEPVAGPLSVTETDRVEYEDGSMEVNTTVTTVWAFTRASDSAKQLADVERKYVLTLVPGTSTDGPAWLVDSWDGTVTTVGDARDAE
jgi:hypothetical protein